MESLKLLGILIVVIGFVLKLDSILIIMIAAIVTALVAGMNPVTFLETLGSSFLANRSMCVCDGYGSYGYFGKKWFKTSSI